MAGIQGFMMIEYQCFASTKAIGSLHKGHSDSSVEPREHAQQSHNDLLAMTEEVWVKVAELSIGIVERCMSVVERG
jgi:hypothetical protein